MSNEGRIELLRAHRAAVEKQVYFLLAAAGAAIAFAISQTQESSLTVSKIPLGLAVLFWASSFWCGCRHVSEVINLTQQNYQLVRAEDGLHPRFPSDPIFIAQIEEMIEGQSEKSGRFSRWQYRLLIAGALFYIVWHVIEMYLRLSVAIPN